MRKTLLSIFLLLLVGLLASGCPKKAVAPDTQAGMESEVKAAKAEETKPAEAESEVSMVSEDVTAKEIARAEETSKPEAAPMAKVQAEDIYFDFDRYEIRKEAKAVLMKLSDTLVKGGGSVLVEGHCDERGTNQYNLALGDRRANAAKEFLVASGVSPNRIKTVSYGEEKPLCTSQTEDCWTKNRRAHFVISGR